VGEAARPRIGTRTLFVAAAVVVVIAGLKAAQSLMLPFLLALFLAIICTPAVTWMTQRKIPAALAVLAVVVVLLAFFSGLGAIVGGSVNEFTSFAAQNQARFDGLVESASTWFEARDIDPETLDILNILSNFFLILLTMIFMLLEATSLPIKVRAAVGSSRFDADNMRQAVIQVQRYLGLKTLTSMATGLLVGFWTAILGLDFAVVWGLLAFLLNYIPSIGSIVAAVPAVLLGLVQGGLGLALFVAVGYLVVNVGIGNFIEPWLMGRTLGLSTLVVFLSLVFWGWVWGGVGMLLSVPLTMIIKILLENTDDLQWLAVMLDNRRCAEKRLEEAGSET
jgi:predicted PurR-regulated permease PerM